MSILHYSVIVPNTTWYYGVYAGFVSPFPPGDAAVTGDLCGESGAVEKSKIQLLRISGSETNIVAHMRKIS